MAIEVDKAMGIHESEVLCLVVGRTSRCEGLLDKTVDLLSAFAAEGEQRFDCLRRIADGLGSEFAELRMGRQHDGNRRADDDHRCGVAAELRILGEAKRGEEGPRLRQVGDGDVEAYLVDHGRWSFDYHFNE